MFFHTSLSDLRWAWKPRIPYNIVVIFFVQNLPPRLWGVRDSYWVAYKLIVWYWRKNKNFLEKLFFFDEKYFSRKIFSTKKSEISRFSSKSQWWNLRFWWDFHQNYVFWKIFFIEKTCFSRNFYFFLQIHPISFYVTKYDHITLNRLGGSSRTKNIMFFYNIGPT